MLELMIGKEGKLKLFYIRCGDEKKNHRNKHRFLHDAADVDKPESRVGTLA